MSWNNINVLQMFRLANSDRILFMILKHLEQVLTLNKNLTHGGKFESSSSKSDSMVANSNPLHHDSKVLGTSPNHEQEKRLSVRL